MSEILNGADDIKFYCSTVTTAKPTIENMKAAMAKFAAFRAEMEQQQRCYIVSAEMMLMLARKLGMSDDTKSIRVASMTIDISPTLPHRRQNEDGTVEVIHAYEFDAAVRDRLREIPAYFEMPLPKIEKHRFMFTKGLGYL